MRAAAPRALSATSSSVERGGVGRFEVVVFAITGDVDVEIGYHRSPEVSGTRFTARYEPTLEL